MAGKQQTLFNYLGQTLSSSSSAKRPQQQQEEDQEVESNFASQNECTKVQNPHYKNVTLNPYTST